MDKKSAISALISGVLCLLIGFTAGQEYVKYEIRSALGGVAAGLQKAFHGNDNLSPETAQAGGEANTRISPAAPMPAPPPPKPAAPSPVNATLLQKGFLPVNADAGRFEATITMKVNFTNTGTKDIRAFEGDLVVNDILGNLLMRISYSVTDPLPAGKTVENDGGVSFNQFEDADVRFRDADMANIKIRFQPTKVLYTDGTTQIWSDIESSAK